MRANSSLRLIMRLLLVCTAILGTLIGATDSRLNAQQPPAANADPQAPKPQKAAAKAEQAKNIQGRKRGADRAQQERDEDELSWEGPFTSVSANEADQTLVFLLITNDDPFSVEPDDGDARHVPDQIWCHTVFADAVRGAFLKRRDLKPQVRLQAMAVGMPAKLTGGKVRNQPSRAVVAICDGNYQLLSLTIGVPETQDLLTMVEDAEEARSIIKLKAGDRNGLVESLVDRSRDRLRRTWQAPLETVATAMGPLGDVEDASVPGALEQRQLARLKLLYESFEPHYIADVQLRFALTKASDRNRLIILEHHVQTRRPWCEAVIPFLVHEDFLTLWQPLCETLWGVPTIQRDATDDELLAWWDNQIESAAVVLSLQPTLIERDSPWPPMEMAGDSRRRPGVDWQDVQKLAAQGPYRVIDAQQLSILMHARDLRSIDIQLPSRARYLFYPRRDDVGLVVREADPPSRFAGRLKRSR